MAGASTTNVKAVAGLTPDKILTLKHNSRHIPQCGLEVISILLFDLFFSHQIVLGAVIGSNRIDGISVRCGCNNYLF